MILGNLKTSCSTTKILLQHKPIWRICFEWIIKLPDVQPFKLYNIDGNIVTAQGVQDVPAARQFQTWRSLVSTVEIHYVFTGFDQLFYRSVMQIGGQPEHKTGSTPDVNNFNRMPGEYVVFFPGDEYKYQDFLKLIGQATKRIVITAPIQRVF